MAGIDIVHVPFRGAGPALTDLLAGRIALLVDQVPTVAPHIQSGALRGLAVASKTRSNLLPNVPTSMEAGLPGYEVNNWNLILAPRGTPKPIIERLNRELVTVLRNPELRARYAELGAEVPEPLSPEETVRFVHDEMKRWGEIVRSTGTTVE
jgi:tripartite-type tricarboxylate transporter receptor subunit TctC